MSKLKYGVGAIILIIVIILSFPKVGSYFGFTGLHNNNNQTVSDNSLTAGKNNKYKAAPAMKIDPQKQYLAEVNTNYGVIKIELFAAKAPLTVNNFVFLAQDHFYNDIRFHRIMKGFMIQTGDPLGNGSGGPGYTFADELPPILPYGPGIVAMANSGPNTNGSQFFICNGESSKQLNSNPNYTVFGRVSAGMDVVEKISNVPVTSNDFSEQSKPTVDVFIKSIKITVK